MEKNDKKPSLRFKGFTDTWEQHKFADIFNYERPDPYIVISDKYNNNYNTPVLTANKGFILGYTNENRTYKKDCIIFDDFTLDSKYVNFEFMVKSSALKILTTKNNINLFFAFERLITSKIENLGHARHYISIVQPTITLIPNNIEQTKIGQLFENIDNLITLHQRKYDTLLAVKKSFLEKMFPADGQNIPKLRFKGFTDTWEQHKFKETVLIERGGSPRPINEFITNDKNGLNWIKIGDAPDLGNYISKTAEKIKPEGLSKTREVYPGDLILSNSMSFGKPYIMAIKGCIHDGWLLIRNNKNIYNLKYLCNILGTSIMLNQYQSLAAGSTVNNLNKDLVGNTIVSSPNKDEQTKIGQLFENIDNLITLHQCK